MRDRTDELRTVIERYEGFEFVGLKIEDAFNPVWWEMVKGEGQENDNLGRELGVDLNDEGKSIQAFYVPSTQSTKSWQNYIWLLLAPQMLLHR